ncbi:Hydroxymethylpyrimidine ABC transporter, substrate-binding component [Paraburkholderia caribensis]|jgi:NitT/TauT family transport system substrate-binding protein|nr:Hydroxymethylpyrimidine ABC transporter, substrate-binding component [Paraburkholderia caribensis]
MEGKTMKRMNARMGAIAAAAAITGFAAQLPAQAAEPVTVYQAFQSIQYLPLYVAIDKGIFAKNGLDVTKVTAGSGAAGVAAVIGGHADFSLQDPMTAVLANLKGASVISVANVVAGVPVWVIAPPDAGVHQPGDMSSKSVAVALPPSTSTYLLQRLIKDQKIEKVSLNTVQLGTELAPVSAGRSQAAAVYEPQADTGIAQGYKIVYGFPKAYPGGYAFSTIDTLASTIKDKPKMVAAFVKSIAEAEALIHQSPQTAKDVAKSEFPSLDPKIVEAAVGRLIDQNIYAPTPDISEQAFRNALDLQESIGNIKPGAATYAGSVDNSFAASLGK